MNYGFSLKSSGQVITINDYFVTIDYTIKVPAERFLLEFTAKRSSAPVTQPSNSSSTSIPTNVTSTPQPSNASTTSASSTSTTESSDSPIIEIGLSIMLTFSTLLLI